MIEEAGDEAAAATRKATGTATPAARVSRPAGARRMRHGPRAEVDMARVPACRGMTPVGRAT